MAIDYFINGVSKDAQDRITHVSLCKNNSSPFSGGVKKSENEANATTKDNLDNSIDMLGFSSL